MQHQALLASGCVSVLAPASQSRQRIRKHCAMTEGARHKLMQQSADVASALSQRGPHAGNPMAAITGGLAIAVPLELRGLELLHSRHGVLPWADLIDPVVPFAEHGFPAHP